MTGKSMLRTGVVRLVVLALLASVLALVGGSGPAGAVENPPPFVTTWGNFPLDGEFSRESGVAVDTNGNVFVVDETSNRVQKFTSNGTFVTKWGTAGTGNGQFNTPTGVAVDTNGNVYVADTLNDRVQKFTSTGTFVTKWGSEGSGDGEFEQPRGVAVDADGNVYVADTLNDRVQKFTSNGTFVTKWGTAGSGDSQFSDPWGVAVDPDGDVYVADTLNDRVQKFTSTGTFLTKWGSEGSGDSQFGDPRGVAVDADGNVYVADTLNDRVQKFTSTGTFLTKWGGDGQVVGVAVGGNGNVYATGNNWVQKFTSTGTLVTKWGGHAGCCETLSFPIGVAVDTNGNVYVADSGANRVQKFTSTGAFVTAWGSEGTRNGQFSYPRGVAVDTNGNVYVVDRNNHRVQKFTSTGTFVTKWGSQGSGDGQFSTPTGVAVDADGNVYVVDWGNNRVQKFTSTGAFLTTWGNFGTGDGQFDRPRGPAVDADGNVYVVDSGNNRVQKFTSTGTFVTKWATIYGRSAVAVDADGNVYVTESNTTSGTGNDRVQKYTSTGTYLTEWGEYGTGDGQFRAPLGVAVDANGNVYVADANNQRVQKFGFFPAVDLRTPPDGVFYDRNQSVTADYSCADETGGSGIVSCVGTVADGSAIDTSTSGDHDFTVTATNGVGNTKAVTYTYTVRDVIDPTVDLRVPPDGVSYDRNQTVIADFSCADEAGGSGIATCVGTVADGSAIDTATLGQKDFTVTATDRAGNTETVSHTYTVVDVIDPTVDLRTPPDGVSYDRNQIVAADYSCDDEAGGSGIATCVGTVPDGSAIETSTLGNHDFAVTATDHRGNTTEVTHSYRVFDLPGDNGRVLFNSRRDGNDEIYVMNANGSGQTRLTVNPAEDIDPAWSRDGSRIAFTSSRDGNREIYVMDADGTHPVRLTTNPAVERHPAWSPDGTQIAFTSSRDGNAEIYVMDADGSGQTRLTDADNYDNWPAWSPDGTRIAFTAARDGNAEVYVMAADGSGETNLTDNSASDLQPAWSPDGADLAFASSRDGNEEIWVMGADGTGAARLTNAPPNNNAPAWSPDGTRIAFSTNRDAGNAEVYVMDADGNGETNLTRRSSIETDSAWQPVDDSTGPVVHLVTPADESVYPRGAVVAADFSCADTPAGVMSCAGTVADGAPIDTATLGDHDFTVTGTDNAGHATTVTHIYTVIDRTDPTVQIRTPDDGAVYDLDQTVAADYSCTDEAGGSGLDDCTGTVVDGAPIDTDTLGDHDFTVTATDNNANTAEVTTTYGVIDADARPDARVKRGASGTYVGNNVYNTTGTGQTVTGTAARGATVTYFVSVQNDAPFTDQLQLRGGTSSSAFTVRYQSRGTDISPAIKAGTYTTPALEPGAAHTIKVIVTARTSAPAGSRLALTLTATSTTDLARRDTAKIVTNRP